METRIDVFAPNRKSVNLCIVIVTTVVFFLLQLWEKAVTNGPFYGNTTKFLLEHGALYAPKIAEGEWYRLLTYLFLHGGIEHLLNNMLILYFIGNALERYLGRLRYGFLYFCAGILAAVGSVVYNEYRLTGTIGFWGLSGEYAYPVCIGASGAVFGVAGALAYLVLVCRGRIKGLGIRQMAAFVVLSVYGGFVDRGVDNAAHIAGLAGGFFLAVLLFGNPKKLMERLSVSEADVSEILSETDGEKED